MKVLLFANTDWYLYNFRRSFATTLRDAGHNVVLVSPPGPYGEKLQTLGFRWIPAPMDRRSLNPWREIQLIIWLWQLMKSERADLVHSFTIKCVVYGAIAARLAGVKARVNAVAGMGYVFTSHDFKARMLRPLVRRLLGTALGGKNTLLILQNPDDVRLFTQAKLIAANRVRLIPGSGVDLSRFFPSESESHVTSTKQPSEPSRLRVLLPARLLWDKGIAEYARAAELLKAEGRAIDFLLAGSPDPGNPAAVPENIVRGWVNAGVLQWLGHVDDMPALFRSVDVVVLPSYREGLPKGLIEAAATEKALITTDAPGCRDVVDHERNGLLVPIRDAQALAHAIARLADDSALRARLAVAARIRALEEFDERLVIQRTLDVYRELLPVTGMEVRG